MAIQINYFSLVIRKNAIETKYPGGLIQYRNDFAYFEDNHLAVLSAMNENDLFNDIDKLKSRAPLLELCTKKEPNKDIMQYQFGFGFWPWYKNDWISQFWDGNNGLVYLRGMEPDVNILRIDYNKKRVEQTLIV